MKPNIFIGSSSENLDIARAIQENLSYDAYCNIWSQGIFDLSKSNLENLIDALDNFDFAIFILFPDDMIKMRDTELNVVRDNVIFELGLFFGKIGRNNVFYVVPSGKFDLHLPTDLLGITSGIFDRKHPNINASLEPFCNQVRKKIKDEYWPFFPKDGLFGFNILNDEIQAIAVENKYSLYCITPNNFKLKLIIRNKSDDPESVWYMIVGNNNGWNKGPYNREEKLQVFKIDGKSKADLEIYFSGNGSATIELYKNSDSSPFKTKNITWK